MKLILDFDCLSNQEKKDITNYTLKQLNDFTEPLNGYNAMLILTSDLFDPSKNLYKVDLSFTSKYYSFTETSIQNDVYDSVNRICKKLKREQKKILWYLKKEKCSGS